jgi:1,4-dihydroxy-2-naphthoate octaprenyltransferase
VSSPNKPLSTYQKWILASRPRTLPAAAAPVVAGAAAAFSDGSFKPVLAVVTLLASLLLQVGANIANDYYDYIKGADTHERTGPTRVTAAGLLTPSQVLAGMWVVFGAAALLGLYLTYEAGWPVIAMGLASIMTAIAYTGGPFPLGYFGLGEVFVFIFFGLIATIGTYYIQVEQVTPLSVWTSVPVGLLIVAILVVNNLRDIPTDRAAGKLTLATRLGEVGTKVEYFVCVGLAYLAPVVMALFKIATPWVLVSWLSIIFLPPVFKLVLSAKGRQLNQALADTGRQALIFAILFGVGLVVGRLL